MAAGRKSKYETHVKPYFEDIKDALERGVEEKQIAENLGVHKSTWCDYKNTYPEFAELFKKKDVSEILKRLEGALMRCAEGYEYTEVKQYITKDEDGKQKVHTEKTTKVQPPNVTAIFGALNRFDPNYVKDKAYYELRLQELELKKMSLEENKW